jgi:hypothetical protein
MPEPTESETTTVDRADEPVVSVPVQADDPVTPVPVQADEALLASVDLARAALLDVTPPETVGGVIGHLVEGEHVLTLLFAADLRGYPGWHWSVTISRVDDAEPTVLETELMPGDAALLAPEWVPWSERLADYRAAQEAIAAAAAAEGGLEVDGELADLDLVEFDDDELDEDSDDDDEDEDDDDHEHDVVDEFDGIDIDALDESDHDEDDDDRRDEVDDAEGDDAEDDESTPSQALEPPAV